MISSSVIRNLPNWLGRRPLFAVFALAGLLFGPLATAETSKIVATTLKIATVSPEGSSWMRVLREAVAEVETATEGRVKFKIYPGGTRGDDAQVLRRIRARALHGGLVTAAVFNSIYKDIQIYNLPMAFRSFQEVDAVRAALDAELLAGLAAVGFECFGIAEVGMAYAMSTKPARTVAEGRRLKVWMPQGDAAAERTLQAFGIAPVPLPIGDVYNGLQTELVDTVAVPPVAAVPLMWHTRLKYIVDLPLMYIYGLFVVKSDALRDVSPPDMEVLRRVMRNATVEADRLNRADHDGAWQALASQGIRTIEPTPAEVEDWRSHAAAASVEWVRRGIVGERIHALLTARLAEIRGAASDG